MLARDRYTYSLCHPSVTVLVHAFSDRCNVENVSCKRIIKGEKKEGLVVMLKVLRCEGIITIKRGCCHVKKNSFVVVEIYGIFATFKNARAHTQNHPTHTYTRAHTHARTRTHAHTHAPHPPPPHTHAHAHTNKRKQTQTHFIKQSDNNIIHDCFNVMNESL